MRRLEQQQRAAAESTEQSRENVDQDGGRKTRLFNIRDASTTLAGYLKINAC